jgi:hypothetical protein
VSFWTSLAVCCASLIALGVGVWRQWHREQRTWNSDDQAEYEALCVVDREADDFDRLRDYWWGDR